MTIDECGSPVRGRQGRGGGDGLNQKNNKYNNQQRLGVEDREGAPSPSASAWTRLTSQTASGAP